MDEVMQSSFRDVGASKLTTLAKALDHAQWGLAVFPCLATKAPACPHGFLDATTDPDALCDLWRLHPGELIGVPTGARNGFDALDIDPCHGGDDWFRQHRDRLPPTRVHRTRSGGFHYLFRHHEGVRNSASRVAPGVDVRGDGGYIVWWPSAWCPGAAPPVVDCAPNAAWPAWLLPQVLPPATPPNPQPTEIPNGSYGDRYVEAAIRRAVEHVRTAGEGRRNDALNAETYALTRFVKAGTITASGIAEAMATAGLSAGLAPREIQATLASALRAGGVA